MPAIAYIGLGSNIEETYRNCIEAIRQLTADERVRLLALSSLYTTSPISPIAQHDFLNGALKIAWNGPPRELLSLLLKIEHKMGRERIIPLGPRIIDLDILLFDDLILDTPALAIPHPRLHVRKFALVPCAEIEPGLVHPRLKRPLAELVSELGDEQEITLFKRISKDEIFCHGPDGSASLAESYSKKKAEAKGRERPG